MAQTPEPVAQTTSAPKNDANNMGSFKHDFPLLKRALALPSLMFFVDQPDTLRVKIDEQWEIWQLAFAEVKSAFEASSSKPFLVGCMNETKHGMYKWQFDLGLIKQKVIFSRGKLKLPEDLGEKIRGIRLIVEQKSIEWIVDTLQSHQFKVELQEDLYGPSYVPPSTTFSSSETTSERFHSGSKTPRLGSLSEVLLPSTFSEPVPQDLEPASQDLEPAPEDLEPTVFPSFPKPVCVEQKALPSLQDFGHHEKKNSIASCFEDASLDHISEKNTFPLSEEALTLLEEALALPSLKAFNKDELRLQYKSQWQLWDTAVDELKTAFETSFNKSDVAYHMDRAQHGLALWAADAEKALTEKSLNGVYHIMYPVELRNTITRFLKQNNQKVTNLMNDTVHSLQKYGLDEGFAPYWDDLNWEETFIRGGPNPRVVVGAPELEVQAPELEVQAPKPEVQAPEPEPQTFGNPNEKPVMRGIGECISSLQKLENDPDILRVEFDNQWKSFQSHVDKALTRFKTSSNTFQLADDMDTLQRGVALWVARAGIVLHKAGVYISLKMYLVRALGWKDSIVQNLKANRLHVTRLDNDIARLLSSYAFDTSHSRVFDPESKMYILVTKPFVRAPKPFMGASEPSCIPFKKKASESFGQKPLKKLSKQATNNSIISHEVIHAARLAIDDADTLATSFLQSLKDGTKKITKLMRVRDKVLIFDNKVSFLDGDSFAGQTLLKGRKRKKVALSKTPLHPSLPSTLSAQQRITLLDIYETGNKAVWIECANVVRNLQTRKTQLVAHLKTMRSLHKGKKLPSEVKHKLTSRIDHLLRLAEEASVRVNNLQNTIKTIKTSLHADAHEINLIHQVYSQYGVFLEIR